MSMPGVGFRSPSFRAGAHQSQSGISPTPLLHAQAKLEPVDLSSFEPSSARKFVFRQLEVMQTGVPRKEAYDIVSKEVAKAA